YTPRVGDGRSPHTIGAADSRSGDNTGGPTSAASPVVINGDFSTTTAVAVNGTPTVGTATTLSAGSYSPAPTGRTYQWRLCNGSETGSASCREGAKYTDTPVADNVDSTPRL